MNWIIWPPTTFTVPMQPLKPERRDSEYVRKGTCSIFVFTEPLAGWRHLSVEERRTKVDGAHQVRELLVVHYPNAGKIKLVMDNWNTHNLSSLYEAFDPETALNLAKRLEIPLYTEAWQLAKHRWNWIKRHDAAMLRSANRGCGYLTAGNWHNGNPNAIPHKRV